MKLVRTSSFRKNVRHLIMLIGAVCGALACAGFVIHGVMSSRSQTSREFSDLARIVAPKCLRSLVSQDHETAREALTPLLADSRISAVRLLDRGNELFVELGRHPGADRINTADHAQPGIRQNVNHLMVSSPIWHGRQTSGTIVIEGDVGGPLARSARYWPFGLSIAAVLLAVTYGLSLVLEPVISGPITRLTEVVSPATSETGEPAKGPSAQPDEIGRLLGRFNELNAVIDEKDRLLAEADSLVEQRVEERTLALNTGIERCRNTEEQLRRSLDEKESLLREIHHRVKNTLQIVSSLLNLQAGHVTDERARDSLKESRDRVQSIVLVHEMSSQTEDLGRIELAPYLRRMSSHVAGGCTSERISVHTRLSSAPVWVEVEQAVPLGLITHELISNSIKYAFPHDVGGEIRIDLRSTNGAVRLEVSDDGVGIPEWVKWNQPTTLGLQLVHGLSQQLGATIELQRGSGTAVVLSLPMPVAEVKG